MRLRVRFLLAIALMPTILVGSLYAYRELVLLPHYRSLEERSVQEDMDRAFMNVERLIQTLDTLNADWSSWDDTYSYMETRDQQYLESNMVTSTFTDLGINVILIMDTDGDVVYGRNVDIDTGADLQLPAGIADQGLVNRTGLIMVDGRNYIYSSEPILTSLDEGPPRGYLVMARMVDEELVTDLRDITSLDIDLRPYAQGNPVELRIDYVDTTHLAAEEVMTDVYGEPTIVVSFNSFRDIYSEGYSKTLTLMRFILLYGVVVGAVSVFYTDKVLLNRLSRLSSDVDQITLDKSITKRLVPDQEDEIGNLAVDINELLDSIVEARRSENEHKEMMDKRERELTYDIIDGARRISERIDDDIGRPLRSMMSIADAIRDEYPEASDLANLLEGNLDHVDKMLYEISSLTSPENLKRTVIDLYEVVNVTLDSMNIPEGVSVHREYSDSFIAIHGDFHRLSRVLRELLINSVDVLEAGGNIWVRLRQTEDYAEVKVSDDGPGISPEARANLFKPFRSSKPRAMGLGLAYSKGVVEAHGGSIIVSGPEVAGTTVTIRLPIQGSTVL